MKKYVEARLGPPETFPLRTSVSSRSSAPLSPSERRRSPLLPVILSSSLLASVFGGLEEASPSPPIRSFRTRRPSQPPSAPPASRKRALRLRLGRPGRGARPSLLSAAEDRAVPSQPPLRRRRRASVPCAAPKLSSNTLQLTLRPASNPNL
jgi:hypothetical protein